MRLSKESITLTDRMAQYEIGTVTTIFFEAMEKYHRTFAMKKKHAAKAWVKRTGIIYSKKRMAQCELEITRKLFIESKDKYKETLVMSKAEAAGAWESRYKL